MIGVFTTGAIMYFPNFLKLGFKSSKHNYVCAMLVTFMLAFTKHFNAFTLHSDTFPPNCI